MDIAFPLEKFCCLRVSIKMYIFISIRIFSINVVVTVSGKVTAYKIAIRKKASKTVIQINLENVPQCQSNPLNLVYMESLSYSFDRLFIA